MEEPHRSGRGCQIPVTTLKGVGPQVQRRLEQLGIASIQDLLFHLPIRYEDRSRRVPLAEICPGASALVEGEVVAKEIAVGRRRSLRVYLEDEGAGLRLRFFHFSGRQAEQLREGVRLRCYGEVRVGPGHQLEMVHPEYRFVDAAAPPLSEALTPVYPTTEGLQQPGLRRLTEQALSWLDQDPEAVADWVPSELLQPLGLPGLVEAVRFLHRPPADADLSALSSGAHPARQRLALEELLAHQLGLRRLRKKRQRLSAPPLSGPDRLRRHLLDALPFRLTGAQRRVVAEIGRDLERERPMLRLLQGDVGSGKTVVAALAALQAVEADHQVALMAPTEILSEQHLRSFREWLEPLGLAPVWLAGRHKGKDRDRVLEQIVSGEARVVVGTHALFQADIRFRKLGLAIIDEQHRFGVHQRLRLTEKGATDLRVPHQLIMTATPIPRSLAMAAYADLDLSVIDERPPGRQPVRTAAVPDGRREEVMARVREACAGGRQAYWVCTLIEESEVLQCQAAEDAARRLIEALPGIRVGLVHGRLRTPEREAVMAEFVSGRIDLLVATTVIEVGVDVPNASLMVIENPERLGLAQLHQLRGRVGRGDAASHCVLLFHPPLSEQARSRLQILRDTDDGFLIAQRDLEMRGPGEVLGTRQTGDMQFKVADLSRDQGLLPLAQRLADEILERYPDRSSPIIDRWVGRRGEYARV